VLNWIEKNILALYRAIRALGLSPSRYNRRKTGPNFQLSTLDCVVALRQKFGFQVSDLLRAFGHRVSDLNSLQFSTAPSHSRSEHHPGADTTNVDHLVASNQKNRQIRSVVALLENPNPPANRDPRIDQHMNDRQNQSAHPSKDASQQHAMDSSVQPGRR